MMLMQNDESRNPNRGNGICRKQPSKYKPRQISRIPENIRKRVIEWHGSDANDIGLAHVTHDAAMLELGENSLNLPREEHLKASISF